MSSSNSNPINFAAIAAAASQPATPAFMPPPNAIGWNKKALQGRITRAVMQERTRLGLTRADEAWKEETLFERVIDDTMEEFDRQFGAGAAR